MIISKFNKKHQGQILLITIMIVSVVLTVFLSVSFKATTETQITKLEEEHQKALAAAQAGLETALKRNANVSIDSSLSQEFEGFSGNAEIKEEISNQFISPLINKNQQYTFYLAQYNPEEKNVTGNSTKQSINVCFNQNNTNRSAIEINLIKSDYSIKRYVYNPNGLTIVNNAQEANSATNCPSGETFYDQITIDANQIDTNSLLLIVRLIDGNASKIGFKAENNFPPQGRTINSTATSQAGVVKKIKLFQSYPQIPSNFFVTTL